MNKSSRCFPVYLAGVHPLQYGGRASDARPTFYAFSPWSAWLSIPPNQIRKQEVTPTWAATLTDSPAPILSEDSSLPPCGIRSQGLWPSCSCMRATGLGNECESAIHVHRNPGLRTRPRVAPRPHSRAGSLPLPGSLAHPLSPSGLWCKQYSFNLALFLCLPIYFIHLQLLSALWFKNRFRGTYLDA